MKDISSRDLNRRRYLATLTAVGGALTATGCTAIGGQHGATDVILYNVRDDAVTVSVTIIKENADEPHTDRTLEIPEGDSVDPVNSSKLPTNNSYTVEVDVVDGATETYEWADPELELSPLYILVDDSENIKFLLHSG